MTMTDQPPQSARIDKEGLRKKYLEERNKRLRPDGNDQYLQIKGQLAHYLDDPYTPVTPRAPKIDHVTFAFIGGGQGFQGVQPRALGAGRPAARHVEARRLEVQPAFAFTKSVAVFPLRQQRLK